MEQFEILIAGAGAAGIGAAKAAYEAGCRRILLVDRKKEPGGVLLQCTHRGFGPRLTGIEYVQKLLKGFPEEICVLTEASVLSVSDEKTAVISGISCGIRKIRFQQFILATGCMEIAMGALPIAGTRPEGIYTAGYVQEMQNLYQKLPESPVVILGSGDLGLIMAEQLSAAGVFIAALVEKRDQCGGMARNQHCLEKYQIPLICSSTITEVFGEEKLTGVRVCSSLTGAEQEISCKTLLIAAGLRPDRTLLHGLKASDWVHVCGNCSRVHPMEEAVTLEGKKAGLAAWNNIKRVNYD